MMDIDEQRQLPTTATIKEERIDFDEEMENKFDASLTPVKRGRTRSLSKKKEDKVDIKAKLERSRQSARECRARKKLRYQYLEEIISETEKAIVSLRRELDMCKIWGKEMDEGKLPENLIQYRTSCVEKKLTNPFQLQQHHHIQIAKQRELQQQKDAAMGGAAGGGGSMQQQRTSPNSALGSGGICISPSSSSTFTSHSLSPGGASGGHLSPFLSRYSTTVTGQSPSISPS